MSSGVEGDLVRPLGFVTLYWAYAEAQLDEVLVSLSLLAPSSSNGRVLTFGAKVPLALKLIAELKAERLESLAAILRDAEPLIRARNELVHGQLFNGGRLVLKTGTKKVTAQEITDLAERIFGWKEQLWLQHCREVFPMISDSRRSNQP